MSRSEARPERYEPPYYAAVVATVATFALYALTLAPTTAFWDTSEYIATAHILGIPHPPGNPLFVVLARAWELLLAPTGLSVAVRINLFSAVMSALAHGCWFLLAHRVLAFFSEQRSFRLIGAAAAVAVSATAFTVWNQSNVNEKVYTVSLFTIALLSWLAFRWRDHVGERKNDNLLLLGVYLLALSVGNHLMAFLAAPALLVFILLIRPRALWNWRLYPAAGLAVVVGLSVHMFLPLRAELGPVINQNDPRCESVGSAVTSVLTMGREGCAELSASLSRQQYQKPSVLHDPIAADNFEIEPRTARLIAAQFANYVQYFDWQWGRGVSGARSWFGGARPFITLLFVLLGALGAAVHYRRDRASWAYLLTLFATLSVGLTFYMNFEYGYTYPAPVDFEMREVRERDYFFIVSFSLWGIWAGIGITTLWHITAQRLAAATLRLGRAPLAVSLDGRHARYLAAPVLALALLPLVLNFSWAARHGDYMAEDWAYNVLMSVGPYGVLFTNGDNDTFPLWHLQEVEGVRRDVTIVVGSYLNTPWYARQIRDLTRPCPTPGADMAQPTRIVCQRSFAAAGTPYAAPRLPPDDSVLPLSQREIEQVASMVYQLDRPAVLRAGNLETTIAAGTYLEPADTFVAAILRATLGSRPIHFMAPHPTAVRLNLLPYTVRTGLTLRLANGPVTADGERIVALEERDSAALGRYIDRPLTDTLLGDVFRYRSAPDTDRPWVDVATTNLLLNYVWTHVAAARGAAAAGDLTAAQEHDSRAERWAQLVR